MKPAYHKTNMIRVEGVFLFYMKGNQVKKVQGVFFVPKIKKRKLLLIAKITKMNENIKFDKNKSLIKKENKGYLAYLTI